MPHAGKRRKGQGGRGGSKSATTAAAASNAPTRLNLHLNLGQSWWQLKGGVDENDEYLQKLLKRKEEAKRLAEESAARASDAAEAAQGKKKPKKHKKKKPATSATSDAETASMPFEDIEKLRKQAGENFVSQVKIFHKKNSGNSDAAWLKTMMRKGTISDRVAAMTLAIQQVCYIHACYFFFLGSLHVVRDLLTGLQS